jgi:hypothetical protein
MGRGLVSNSSLGLYTSAAIGKQSRLRPGGTDSRNLALRDWNA